MGKTIDDEILDELLKGCERPEDLLGGGGLLKELKKAQTSGCSWIALPSTRIGSKA